MYKLASNNNGKSIRHLASGELKHSRMRNFFVIVTIILSVSLLMTAALFTIGMQTELRRQAADMQHVIYMEADKESVEKLVESPETEYVLTAKRGFGMEIDQRQIQFSSYALHPLKSEGTEVETVQPVKGTRPQAYDEVMISDVYCDVLGISAEPGEKISFTFLDGTTEEFTVSGIYHAEGAQKVHSVILSEEYGERGTQLKDCPYSVIVRIHGADKMNMSTFLTTIRELAKECGIERKYVNENNHFLRTLSGRENENAQNLTVLGIGIGILFVSVLVIYSVFYLAVVGKIRQFGQLRTIGMTKKQIRKMVRTEGLYLCAAGIPIGLLIGGITAYFLKPGGWDWKNTILTAAAVTIMDMLTVLISVGKPAKIAASVSPVEAAKYSGYEEQGNIKGTAKLSRKITPYTLAAMSSSRNRKKTALTMISLGVGGVLYMLAAFFVTSTSLDGYARQGAMKYGEFVLGFSYNVVETTEHGRTGIQMNNPFNEELRERIESINGVEEVRTFQEAEIRFTYQNEETGEFITPFQREDVEVIQPMLEEGELDYDRMIKEKQIVITCNDLMEEIYGWRFEVGTPIELNWYDGQQERREIFEVGAIADEDAYISEYNNSAAFTIPEETLDEMMNGMNLTSEMAVRVDEEKYAQAEAELNQILGEYPELGMRTLGEEKEFAEYQFSIIFSVCIGLAVFIVAFSILNLLNTLITNILTRKQEFAMLQSVGMTTGQVTRMVQTESLRLMAGNLIVTLLIGSAAGWGYVKIMRLFGADYVSYHFPVWFFLGYAVFTVMAAVGVSTVLIRSYQKQPLTERLRQ